MTTETETKERTDQEEAELMQSSVDVNEFEEPLTEEPLTEEPLTEEGISDAENRLIEIQNAAADVRKADCQVESLKEDLKEAKAYSDLMVTRMVNMIEQEKNDADRPLLNLDHSIFGVEDEPDDAWKALSIDTLWKDEEIKGFGPAKREAIVDEVGTLLGFLELTQAVGKKADHLSKLLPSGCGEKLADELENRFLYLVANWANRPTEPEFNLQSVIDKVTSDEDWMDKIESDDDFEDGKRDFEDGKEIEELQDSILENKTPCDELEQWARGYAYASAEHEANNHNADDEYENVPDDDDIDEL